MSSDDFPEGAKSSGQEVALEWTADPEIRKALNDRWEWLEHQDGCGLAHAVPFRDRAG